MAEKLVVVISGDAKKLISELKKSEAAVTGFGSKSKAAGGNVGLLNKNLAGLGASAVAPLAAAASLGVLASKTKESIDLAREQAKAEAQLAAVIESTGGAAGLSADELKKMAAELQGVTNFGDEATIAGQSLLLTFTKIGKDVFPRATKAMLDMSVSMKQDMKSSAIQLGKALNDPVQGVTALQRVGIQFTDQQKDLIKTFVESNRVMDAQNVILDELERQFGGSAEAARKADGGFIAASNAIGDMQEAIGFLLLPTMEMLNSRVIEGTGDVQRFIATLAQWGVTAENVAWAVGQIFELGSLISGVGPLFDALDQLGIIQESVVEVTDLQTESVTDLNAALAAEAEAHALTVEEIKKQEEAQRSLLMTQAGYLTGVQDLHKAEQESAKALRDAIRQAEADSRAGQLDAEKSFNDERSAIVAEWQQKTSAAELERAQGATGTANHMIAEADRWKNEQLAKIEEEKNEELRIVAEKEEELKARAEAKRAEEQEKHKEHMQNLVLETVLAQAEAQGSLEQITGLSGVNAKQAADLIKAGVISISQETLTEVQRLSSQMTTDMNASTANQTQSFHFMQAAIDGDLKKVEDGMKRLPSASKIAGDSIKTQLPMASRQATSKVVSDFQKVDGAIKRTKGEMDRFSVAARTAILTMEKDLRGGSFGSRQPIVRAAGGADFIVPPGYNNDDFMVGTSTGEHVKVIPKSEVNNNFNMTVNTQASQSSVSQDFRMMQSLV